MSSESPKCKINVYNIYIFSFFLVFRNTSSFLEVSLNRGSLAELCGKKMTQCVFVKTNLHFYHLTWTGQLLLRETFWPLSSSMLQWCTLCSQPQVASLFPQHQHNVHYQLQDREKRAGMAHVSSTRCHNSTWLPVSLKCFSVQSQ